MPEPSPWLNPNNPPNNPDPSASFVEYLRWMREPNPDDRTDPTTKNQILQLAVENANYADHLERRNNRTRSIATSGQGEVFEVSCPWRIRVGGHRGPESTLLPAFDALGMPYIPSATLRGVARNQAVRQVMREKACDWKTASEDPLVVKHFGALQADAADQAGKVIFLDAYPVAEECTLAMDIANNIWSWTNNQLNYKPNPNTFLSLKCTKFMIGLCLTSNHKGKIEILEQVKTWLIAGLESGIGSQVNSGYGQLVISEKNILNPSFLTVNFDLKGQLIHGAQEFDDIDNTSQRPVSQDEVRAIAFKSMLRYWFRVLALGKIDIQEIKRLELNLFGGIQPKATLGWVRFSAIENKDKYEPSPPLGRSGQGQKNGRQFGILHLAFSESVPCQEKTQKTIEQLFQSLIWIAFRLGGVGQGARRPMYKRDNAPWYRGSSVSLFNKDETLKRIWSLPRNAEQFEIRLTKQIKSFYKALNSLSLNAAAPLQFIPSVYQWRESLDAHARIFVLSHSQEIKLGEKPKTLKILHNQFHSLDKQLKEIQKDLKDIKKGVKRVDFDEKKELQFRKNELIGDIKNLCGFTESDVTHGVSRGATPSPIWIANHKLYHVVTVFGVDNDPNNPRTDFCEKLSQSENCIQVFPFT
ncbi:RAMP superfamily CRISPR-associated protein [Spirulina sp. CCNP1310]|uniref:RAMP superfamily CRISPR-associated protein n=1 Tax=Spirulina sp. CCNP1310 TaxID=3110249 RepID=UPI002B21BA26|nr:RAMP superfamily CRISPR-associated protein [Spirulina sp. CCNP1310]MEA5421097.1 RAMP superfamily CRISPR-associated protein [Spirulina sp. CCNP1310]